MSIRSAIKSLSYGVLVSLFLVSGASAKDWSKESTWLHGSKYECEEMHKNLRKYHASNRSGSKIAISYCNRGAYVVKNIKVKIFRTEDGWTPKIYQQEKHENLQKDHGHVFFADPGPNNAGDELKIEIVYEIDVSKKKKKRCKKKFTYDYKDVLYMTKSEGTKWNADCKVVTFQQKS